LAAVDSVSLTVVEGERHALIGPNGAGKSTLFKMIAGRTKPSKGRVEFRGRDITGMGEEQRVRAGMAVTFQTSELFESLTVRENLALAVRRHRGVSARWFRPAFDPNIDEEVEAALRQFHLDDEASRPAISLSHGQRRHLEIALALASEPSLLMLDEPVAGMSPAEAMAFVELVDSLRAVTIVIIEHNLDVVARVATRVSVLDSGVLIACGHPKEIAANEAVQAAYLGVERDGGWFT
jgi:branched-chain amino acid transport system ATP-binding protein